MNTEKLAEYLDLGDIIPRWYQTEAHELTAAHIRKSAEPAYINATVGSGKTISIAMICKQAQIKGMSVLVMARQGELVEQNAAELWNCGVKNSVYSASLGLKSTKFPIIVGTEGSVCRSLQGDLKDYRADILLVDECHMVDFSEPNSQYMKIIECMRSRNKKLRIIGFTGSPFRGIDPIKGDFWKKELYSIDTDTLVSEGYLVPTIFGATDEHYNLDNFKSQGAHGSVDFTAKEMAAMETAILEDMTTTQKIMAEVVDLTKHRNGVLITCAGERHCREASAFLPEGSFGIVTDKTPRKKRREILKGAYNGSIKYVFQVGCLTTGVNIPLWDTSVILRKIGSLTLLVQLLGRGMRTLKPEQMEEGFTKADHLVLDYSATMAEMGGLYESPMLEEAEYQRAQREQDIIECPKCGESNSAKARRCRGESNGERCDHFWQSVECHECGTENDIVARVCRNCDVTLRDPNENLINKHYTNAEWREVERFEIGRTRCGKGVLVKYHLVDGESASEVFWPASDKLVARKMLETKLLVPHMGCKRMAYRFSKSCRSAETIVKNKAMLAAPTHITVRKGKRGDIIARKRFASGRVEKA